MYIAALLLAVERSHIYAPCSEQSVPCPVQYVPVFVHLLYIGELLSLLLYLEPAILFTFTVTSDDPDIETDTPQLLSGGPCFLQAPRSREIAALLVRCGLCSCCGAVPRVRAHTRALRVPLAV